MQDSANVTSSTKTNTMKSKQLIINGVDIIVHSDGSITKPFRKKWIRRTFGTLDKGYMKVSIGKKSYQVHRIVAQAFFSHFFALPQVDHISNDGTNNDIRNLRMVTHQKNQQAKQRKRKNCSSQFRGVSWSNRSKKWYAQCTINRKKKNLGYFDNELDAAIARDAYWFSQGLPIEGLNFPEN
jgi:hypothetical protein